MKRKVLIVAAMLLAATGARAQSLEEARAALHANRVSDAERILAQIVANPAASPSDRARAFRLSARIAWRIDGDVPRALTTLHEAERTGAEPCATANELVRLLQEAERGADLLAQVDALASKCPEPGRADSLLSAAADAALDEAARSGSDRDALLARADALLAAASDDTRASLSGASLDLQLALLGRDAGRALRAWRNYFWLHDSNLPPGLAGGRDAIHDLRPCR